MSLHIYQILEDTGVCDTAGAISLVQSAADSVKVPIISDRIICYPSLSGKIMI